MVSALNEIYGRLFYDARIKKASGTFDTASRDRVRLYAERALAEKEYYHASHLYEVLEDNDKLLEIANRSLTEWDDIHVANKLFNQFRKRPELLQIVQKLYDEGRDPDWGPVGSYYGKNFVIEEFQKWQTELGFEGAGIHVPIASKLAYNLADKFDIGVGIARGGLQLAYMFGLFGMNTKIANTHKIGRSENVSFRWATEVKPEDFHGKSVLVFDKDVVTGRTTRKVLEKILKYEPSNVSLCLIHEPRSSEGSMGTVTENIPKGYSQVYFARDFDYRNIDKIVQKLETALEGK